MPRQAGKEREVLAEPHSLVWGGEVEQDSEVSADVVWGLSDMNAAHDGVPRIGLRDAGEDAEARRLARPVRTEEAEHLALPDLEGYVVKRACLRVRLREPGGLDKHPARDPGGRG